jgi:hypothetical protein
VRPNLPTSPKPATIAILPASSIRAAANGRQALATPVQIVNFDFMTLSFTLVARNSGFASRSSV